ncbi:MAG TPA: hypothetical protein VHH73_05210 [Verrucomicrobiae bacterium]|nr:hypothetical protein [Verrucomicrobiae bacterium]
MDVLIYRLGRVVIVLIQLLPLRWVAQLGRTGGRLAFYLDRRHRRVALQNLAMCFGDEKSPAEITVIARENFCRIGENYASAIKTSAMSLEELRPHLEFSGFEKLPPGRDHKGARNVVAAIGHFGNFELYARIQEVRADWQGATTYRALKPAGMNRLLQSLRGVNGCRFFERRTEGGELRELMNRGGILLGLLTDQHSTGMRAPFLGHDCHTNLGAAVLALRYQCELYSIICHRVGFAQWRLEVGEQIQTHANGSARSSQEIMRDVNLAFEKAVRRDPANWFWVHRRWKNLPATISERRGKSGGSYAKYPSSRREA